MTLVLYNAKKNKIGLWREDFSPFWGKWSFYCKDIEFLIARGWEVIGTL